jgi:hypothetical protein
MNYRMKWAPGSASTATAPPAPDSSVEASPAPRHTTCPKPVFARQDVSQPDFCWTRLLDEESDEANETSKLIAFTTALRAIARGLRRPPTCDCRAGAAPAKSIEGSCGREELGAVGPAEEIGCAVGLTEPNAWINPEGLTRRCTSRTATLSPGLVAWPAVLTGRGGTARLG